jgi:hypothetical protein
VTLTILAANSPRQQNIIANLRMFSGPWDEPMPNFYHPVVNK